MLCPSHTDTTSVPSTSRAKTSMATPMAISASSSENPCDLKNPCDLRGSFFNLDSTGEGSMTPMGTACQHRAFLPGTPPNIHHCLRASSWKNFLPLLTAVRETPPSFSTNLMTRLRSPSPNLLMALSIRCVASGCDEPRSSRDAPSARGHYSTRFVSGSIRCSRARGGPPARHPWRANGPALRWPCAPAPSSPRNSPSGARERHAPLWPYPIRPFARRVGRAFPVAKRPACNPGSAVAKSAVPAGAALSSRAKPQSPLALRIENMFLVIVALAIAAAGPAERLVGDRHTVRDRLRPARRRHARLVPRQQIRK